ncbi:putative membrane-associated metalloprotease [Thermococcus cleftensis]|uniref:Membrane-associated metalloprotease n=1 Tax=Thermococcus cleftensis (strain DSM 27260 / KACC 17922 / CL1) TaxID=163003 RepID=I3ZRB2_THECF|nr:CPBP family archaeomyxosortase MrtA [Thermococcus cleftensis]AFL94246.1 putative membrane-associated metalloprotease [Thermococcus cleftensis]
MRLKNNPYALYLLSLPFILAVRYSGGDLFSWAVYNTLFYFALPLVLAYALGFERGELGVRVGALKEYRWALLLFIASLPLSIYGATLPEMKAYYPIFDFSGPLDFLLKELAVGAIMFAHEAFYRGILLFPLARRNEWLGILAQDVPYALVHIGKPGIEVPYSFVAGIVFAKLDLRAGSFLPSFLLHWLGAVLFDVLCVLL